MACRVNLCWERQIHLHARHEWFRRLFNGCETRKGSWPSDLGRELMESLACQSLQGCSKTHSAIRLMMRTNSEVDGNGRTWNEPRSGQLSALRWQAQVRYIRYGRFRIDQTNRGSRPVSLVSIGWHVWLIIIAPHLPLYLIVRGCVTTTDDDTCSEVNGNG